MKKIIIVLFLLSVKAFPQNCTAYFIWDPNDTIPFNINFLDISFDSITSWSWDFGDSTYSNLQNPSHQYSGTGMYITCLTISDSSGTCTNTFCDTIILMGTEANNFIYFPTETANTIKFCEVPIYGLCGPNTYHWDFGDSTTSNLRLPVHTYSTPGIYDVCLTENYLSSVCWQVCHFVKVGNILPHTSISVCDGYWSDPYTWNTMQVPSLYDSVLIYNHVVLDSDIIILYPGLLYIEENSSLCGHFSLTGEIITYGVLNLDFATICGGYSDFQPINITNTVQFGGCFGSDIYSMQYWPTSNSYTCNNPPPCTTIINENKIENSFINIYPNPFSTKTTLQTDKLFKEATLKVFNSFGQLVKQIKNISGQTITLHRDNLPNGLYLLQLIQDNKISTTDKIVITDK